jgi:hypothetical protein
MQAIEECAPQTIPVPEELAKYGIEQAKAADFDFLLRGGGYE